MKKEDVKLSDLNRILFGEAPPEFLLEVFIRTLIVYILTLFVMRFLGKRMNGQLSILEFGVMISMGAIISVPMQVPDKGMLPGIVALFGILVILRGINWLAIKNRKFEYLTQGRAKMLVKDGVMDLDQMSKTSVSRQQLFSQLRIRKIYNLGMVKRVYLESCGLFSIYTDGQDRPGLSVFPAVDDRILESGRTDEKQKVCISCGYVVGHEKKPGKCPNCGKEKFENAIVQG